MEVVGDEEVGETEPPAQVHQEVQDLSLDRYIQRRDRLVGHDEARVQRQRRRDPDALALPTRELVRIALGEGRIQPDHLEQTGHPVPQSGGVVPAVDLERLRDDAPHAHPGVQRAEGVLEDDLHALAGGPQLSPREGNEVAPLEADAPAARLQQPEDQPACRRLAAPGFTDQPQRLPRLQGEAHSVDRADHTASPGEPRPAHIEPLLEPGHLEERDRHQEVTGQATR